MKAASFFVSHGGGPCWFMEGGMFAAIDKNSKGAAFLRNLSKSLPPKPKAIVVISAHWEERKIKITNNPAPPMFYDYYGFPDETYKLTYPAKCDVELANRIHQILTDNKIESEFDSKRGWDHGVFIPLKLIYPDADIPLVQISLNSNLDPAFHYRLGQLLGPLREEGVMIMGSGQATHNMRDLMNHMTYSVYPPAVEFVSWMNSVVQQPSGEVRQKSLVEWAKAPQARQNHPREEHLIPLMVVAGAAHNDEAGKVLYDEVVGAMGLQSYSFEK